jgi:hypothetical protein
MFYTPDAAFQAIQTIRPETRLRLRVLRFIFTTDSHSRFVSHCAAVDLSIPRLREQFPNLAIHVTVPRLPSLTQSGAEYFPLSHAEISILWCAHSPLLFCGTACETHLQTDFGPFTNEHWDESVVPVSDSGGGIQAGPDGLSE